MIDDKKFIRLAIEQALEAGRMGEVPVGAVITDASQNVISRAHNLREKSNDPTAHAEVLALREASEKLRSWRLEDCTLYVTLEPCAMCMGAIVLSRIKRLVFGARDPKAGAVVSLYSIGTDKTLNHRVEYTEGVLSGECSDVLKDFFMALRTNSD